MQAAATSPEDVAAAALDAIVHQRFLVLPSPETLPMLGQRLGFLIVVMLVWAGHRQALRAGGYGWRRYWRAAWDRMNGCWRQMTPRRIPTTSPPLSS